MCRYCNLQEKIEMICIRSPVDYFFSPEATTTVNETKNITLTLSNQSSETKINERRSSLHWYSPFSLMQFRKEKMMIKSHVM